MASGEKNRLGRQAGHSQVSLWRDWKQTAPTVLEPLLASSDVQDGKRCQSTRPSDIPVVTFNAFQTEQGYRSDQIGLVLPTSLCSGQIAQMIAERLNAREVGHEKGISRFVSLPHTEGCGVSSGRSEEITRALLSDISFIRALHTGCLLEHGCEKTHNDHVADALESCGVSLGDYGWASVQP